MKLVLLEGTYSKFELTRSSKLHLKRWMDYVGVEAQVPIEHLHVSLISSPDVDIDQDYYVWVKTSRKFPDRILIDPDTYYLDTRNFGDAVVLGFESNILQKYYRETLKFGAKYVYNSYKPHVTLSYVKQVNLHLRKKDVPLPRFPLEIINDEIILPYDRQGYLEKTVTEDGEPVQASEPPSNNTNNIAAPSFPMSYKILRRRRKV